MFIKYIEKNTLDINNINTKKGKLYQSYAWKLLQLIAKLIRFLINLSNFKPRQ